MSIGLEVTIDDFGTGYSSMAYLKRFALDRLKIDATFVRGTPEDKDDVAIVQATIALARQFRLRVTAEGVETPAQRTFLKAHDCDAIQGFLISAPMPGQDVSAMLSLATPHDVCLHCVMPGYSAFPRSHFPSLLATARDGRTVALTPGAVIGGHREVPGGLRQSAQHVARQSRVRERDTLPQVRGGSVIDVVARQVGQGAAVVILRGRRPGERGGARSRGRTRARRRGAERI